MILSNENRLFDEDCFGLAVHFLPSNASRTDMIQLACHIQEAVEYWEKANHQEGEAI